MASRPDGWNRSHRGCGINTAFIVFSVELFICERRVCPHRTVPNSVTSAHSSEIASRKH
ncbi:hypothetical protein CISG_06041 [Coccidioides immitis RMSCC 3703]|uniref:Uncharacterized protein n=1 Tax=Coccidioides immitis RMSCC 3703 TaxID=454286 RepID=A0A0J8TTS1_COCIT|nr:hypothetical protein CISG_06041 [Coccidioides immitis RMSCC 3703]